jgi:hypothetical protein
VELPRGADGSPKHGRSVSQHTQQGVLARPLAISIEKAEEFS